MERTSRCSACDLLFSIDDSDETLCLLCRPKPCLRINFGGRPVVFIHTRDGVKKYKGIGA